VLPVRHSMEEQLAQFRSDRTRRRVQHTLHQGVSWRLSKKPEDFHQFYDRLYVPTAVARFGSNASVTPREELLEHFTQSGMVMLVDAQDGKPAGGALMCTYPLRPHQLHYWKEGVENCASLTANQLTEVHSQLLAALFQYAQQEHFSEIHMGLTRALLNDGVFVHKRRMGCLFQLNPAGAQLAVRFRPAVPQLLLAHCPMLMWTRSQPVAWLGLDGELDDDSAARLHDELVTAAFAPVKHLCVFTRATGRTRNMLLDVVAQVQDEHNVVVECVDALAVPVRTPVDTSMEHHR